MAPRAPHARAGREDPAGTCAAAPGTSFPGALGSCGSPRGTAQGPPPSAGARVTLPRLHPPAPSARRCGGAVCTPGLAARRCSHTPGRRRRREALCCPPLATESFSLKSTVLCCALRFVGLCWRLFISIIFLTILGLYDSEASRMKGELMLHITEGNPDWLRAIFATGPWI